MRYLVDTSVWIDFIQGHTGEHVEFLDENIRLQPASVGLTTHIYLEILQGTRSEEAFARQKHYFSTQRFYEFDDELAGYESAARIFRLCKQKGITIRSSIDCLIAQCAVENQICLLHHDRDFLNISSVVPDLDQMNFLPGLS